MKKLKRFIAACFAMNGILSPNETVSAIARGLNTDETTSELIRLSYLAADELLKQETL